MSEEPPTDQSLDTSHVDTLLKSRERCGEKLPTTVRIFERNDFYYFFDRDGELAAEKVYGSVTSMKSMGREGVPFCVMNQANFESVLRYILLVRHLRVEIFKFVAAKGGRPATYEQAVRASPGNVAEIEHLLYGENDIIRECNYLLGLKVHPGPGDQITVGVAAVDTSLKMVQVCDFMDTENYSHLESVLVQICPREVILPQSELASIKKARQIVERNRILVTCRPTADFSALGEAETRRLINAKSNREAINLNPAASGASAAVFKYLGVLGTDKDEGTFRVELMKPTEHMRIDSRTLIGLNLLEDPSQPGQSVFDILNRTRTPGGCRLLQSWIKQPLIQADKINERLDLVEAFVESTDLRQNLYEDHLRKMPDFQRLATRFQSKRATLQDMYKVYVAVGKLPGLVALLATHSACPALRDNFTQELEAAAKDFDKFLQLVETTLDLDQVRLGQFLIKPDFDENLGELRTELDSLEGQIQRALSGCASALGLEAEKVLKLEQSSQHGYYFRLTMKEEKSVRNDRSFTIIEANKSGIKFRNKKLDQLNESYMDVAKRYEQQQAAIVTEMMGVAGGYADLMVHLGGVISQLDVTVGLAVAALTAPTPFTRPQVLGEDTDRVLELNQVRHPIVELQEAVSYIANDVAFSPTTSTLHLITGPNMGGKSTYIRSVGVAVLMAQMGSFIPAEPGSRLSIVDSVMVRIGASDCQVKGISTFMAEMLETSSILQNATARSLILIDELGRGTSTYDGFGIAWAVSEHIAKNIGCFTLFTTHYTELTLLANEVPTVHNYHVTALTDDGKLTLLYQVKPGVCDKSFGLHVAKIAHFPEDVINDAALRLQRLEEGMVVD